LFLLLSDIDVLDASLLAIARTFGLDADRLMTVEVLPRFVGPLRRAINGETTGWPFDIRMLVGLMSVLRRPGSAKVWPASLAGLVDFGSIAGRAEGAGIQCSTARGALDPWTMQ
jgi:hypothetical protein